MSPGLGELSSIFVLVTGCFGMGAFSTMPEQQEVSAGIGAEKDRVGLKNASKAGANCCLWPNGHYLRTEFVMVGTVNDFEPLSSVVTIIWLS